MNNQITGIKTDPGVKYKTKKKQKETPPDSFKKSDTPGRLEADVMKDLHKTLSETKITDDVKIIDENTFPRPMTDYEKASFKEYFPKLDLDKAVVSGPATPEYNCIAWTVGETKEWCWPPAMYPSVSEEESFNKFYASYGFKPAPEGGEVARWRNAQGLTHGSVSGPEHGPRWESKCGQELKIQHGKDELQGEIYGWIDSYYTKEGDVSIRPAYKEIKLSDKVKEGIKQKALKVPEKTKKEFNKLYEDWQEFRKKPSVQFSSNPKDYCKTESFEKITKMGKNVIPLLMEKISEGDFFSLQALGEIAKSDRGMERAMRFTPEEANNSEQNRANLALLKWYKE